MAVTRRKRIVKDPARDAFEGLKSSIQQANKEFDNSAGMGPSAGSRRGTKSEAKPKDADKTLPQCPVTLQSLSK